VPNSKLVFNGVKDMIDRYPRWDEVGSVSFPLLDSIACLAGSLTVEAL